MTNSSVANHPITGCSALSTYWMNFQLSNALADECLHGFVVLQNIDDFGSNTGCHPSARAADDLAGHEATVDAGSHGHARAITGFDG